MRRSGLRSLLLTAAALSLAAGGAARAQSQGDLTGSVGVFVEPAATRKRAPRTAEREPPRRAYASRRARANRPARDQAGATPAAAPASRPVRNTAGPRPAAPSVSP